MDEENKISRKLVPSGDNLSVSNDGDSGWVGESSATSPDRTPTVNSKEINQNVQELRRSPTGIADLDPLIEGGFPAGKSCLITGGAGLGKSIFCMQFVLRGLLDGEKAVYVAVDNKPAEIVEEAASLGWDFLPYVEGKQLLILDASPYFTTRMGLGKDKEIDITKTVGDLSSYVKKVGASRVVIDPVAPLIASSGTEKGLRERARVLVHALQENMESTNLLTSYAINGGAFGGHQAEEFPMTGVVALKFARREKGLIRTLVLNKMRGTQIDLTEYKFDIVRGKGIVMSPIPHEPDSIPDTPATPEPPNPHEAVVNLFKEWHRGGVKTSMKDS